MRRIYYISLFFLFFLKANSQTYSKLVSDKSIESFLNWETQDLESRLGKKSHCNPKIKKSIIPWEEALIGMMGSANFPNTFENQLDQIRKNESSSKKYDSKLKFDQLFDSENINYLKVQFQNATPNANWNGNIGKVKFRKNPNNNYYKYTVPLFDKDNSLAIMYKEFYCGSLCAYGVINIYKKENGSWKLYKSSGCWIS